MVVTNAHRTTAIVIRHDGRHVSLVPMKGGRLSARRLERNRFEAEWREMDYDLGRALDFFLQHADAQGATREAFEGLRRLAERERRVVAGLF
jgi:hypothetical protein